MNKYAGNRIKKRKYTHILSKRQEIPLSDSDRITYVFKYQRYNRKKIEIIEVVTVSYEIYYENSWMTIIYYDSTHGFLHRHIRISVRNTGDTVTDEGVKHKGDHARWLKWAINDLQNRFVYYRKEFLKRSKEKSVDMI